MSAHQRARSTSKTAPKPRTDVAKPQETLPIPNSSHRDPSPHSPAHVPVPVQPTMTVDATDREFDAAAMLSTLAAPGLGSAEPQLAEVNDLAFDHHDDRSSSLSELGDASDDQSEPTPRPVTALDIADNDSEAETERLENTPRKLMRTATDTSLASELVYQRTPSKLAHSKTIDETEIAPFDAVDDTRPIKSIDSNSALHALSLAASSEAASFTEGVGKKRKRPSMEPNSPEEQDEEPARKRSGTDKDSVQHEPQDDAVESLGQVDAEDELETAEERISQLAQEEAELAERQADIAAETVNELATVAKHTKPRKGGRRGKRKLDDMSHVGEALASIEGPEGEGDGDDEEDDSGAVDEEVAKKKHAIEELGKIQKKFKIFREKLCDEQIAQCEQELEMLKQPNCEHPEYLAMIKAVDERRAEKIAYERQLLQYKQRNLEIITTAERHQLHSQYFQTVRDKREEILSLCNQKIFELQRGRRQLGLDEVEYMMKLPEKRSDQIRHQAAYNIEVSILSGVAKYVGFPAAPEIRPARTSEIEDDLRAMKIAIRPPVTAAAVTAPSYVRPSYARTSTADEAAAEEQFIERTPWANPQHPAHQQSHQQSHYGVASGVPRVSSYHTPTGQRRMEAPNGSASTIEAHSNPPSSGIQNNHGRVGESESPVLQMKRHPGEHHMYAETPGSIHRNIAGVGRESYGMSSPAGPHLDAASDDHLPRWGGMRPGASLPGRPDSTRVPLTQRSALGTVSVGSGNGLFGR
ncbi:hypothetical protein BU23DRAFT_557859 [Bimuria novae-zelandiae CBS 107.79]|uniref:Transcriptional regulatory protein DEP1 n=1 Tax=Bimuria novae-zelandiae CBS 107.79 TaxID=1447943 RepID=A0A6A5UWU8_9PLEO|nr:hypothetical protein BU23DRAFT_557859 [Bimuria novae-zelandiae CBS 107.79]